MAIKRLCIELKDILKDPNYHYSCTPTDSMLIWNFTMIGPSDTLYEHGIFTGSMIFPLSYPIKPPKVIFNNILHPNIYTNGDVCISILHEGTDLYGYEKDYERWNPSQNINSIMLSILSMLSTPNFDSSANIEASLLWKNDPSKYKAIIYKLVSTSHNIIL